MITSRLTSKAQTTIPQPVRIALGLRAGDDVAYAIQGGRAVITRVSPAVVQDDPFAMFSEWDSPEDDDAYRGL